MAEGGIDADLELATRTQTEEAEVKADGAVDGEAAAGTEVVSQTKIETAEPVETKAEDQTSESKAAEQNLVKADSAVDGEAAAGTEVASQTESKTAKPAETEADDETSDTKAAEQNPVKADSAVDGKVAAGTEVSSRTEIDKAEPAETEVEDQTSGTKAAEQNPVKADSAVVDGEAAAGTEDASHTEPETSKPADTEADNEKSETKAAEQKPVNAGGAVDGEAAAGTEVVSQTEPETAKPAETKAEDQASGAVASEQQLCESQPPAKKKKKPKPRGYLFIYGGSHMMLDVTPPKMRYDYEPDPVYFGPMTEAQAEVARLTHPKHWKTNSVALWKFATYLTDYYFNRLLGVIFAMLVMPNTKESTGSVFVETHLKWDAEVTTVQYVRQCLICWKDNDPDASTVRFLEVLKRLYLYGSIGPIKEYMEVIDEATGLPYIDPPRIPDPEIEYPAVTINPLTIMHTDHENYLIGTAAPKWKKILPWLHNSAIGLRAFPEPEKKIEELMTTRSNASERMKAMLDEWLAQSPRHRHLNRIGEAIRMSGYRSVVHKLLDISFQLSMERPTGFETLVILDECKQDL